MSARTVTDRRHMTTHVYRLLMVDALKLSGSCSLSNTQCKKRTKKEPYNTSIHFLEQANKELQEKPKVLD